MRHYYRESYRHLDDGERYRDYDYVAEDGWEGRSAALRADASVAFDESSDSSTEKTSRSSEEPRRLLTSRGVGRIEEFVRNRGTFLKRLVRGIFSRKNR